jgi:hypothetical protein
MHGQLLAQGCSIPIRALCVCSSHPAAGSDATPGSRWADNWTTPSSRTDRAWSTPRVAWPTHARRRS